MNVFDKIKNRIVDYLDLSKEAAKDITLETKLDNLGLDSLDIIELLAYIEEDFSLRANQLDGFNTIDQLVRYIQSDIDRFPFA